jgi:cbb3-type cytochrome oxidase subunit 3
MDAAQTILGLAMFGGLLAVAIWVWKDAAKRGMSPRWGIGVFWMLIVFLPLYFVFRKPLRSSECDEQAPDKASDSDARQGRIFG